MKKIIFVTFCSLFTLVAMAQKGLIKGKVLDDATNKPIVEALITITRAKITTSTNGNGEFSVSNLPYGSYEVEVEADGYEATTSTVSVNDKVNTENEIRLTALESKKTDNAVAQNAPITEDANTDDEGSSSGSQNVGSVLNASRDPFISASTFSWGNYFFRNRGYEQDHNQIYINGLVLNDLEEGAVGFSNISGLNDVLRSRSNSYGLQFNEAGFGGLGLTTSIDASAATQRKQTRITYSNGNRSYRNRLMLTHSSGLNKNGWAYSFSGSRRWANEGPVQGTFYNAASYYASIEKKYKKHNIGLMVLGAPTQRGKQGIALQESIDMTGNNLYNPHWGYQNGKKRNSRVLNSHQPIIMLNDEIMLSSTSRLSAAVSYQNGRTSNSGIDWYNGDNPRADYYRYLPSYWEYEQAPGIGDSIAEAYSQNPDLLQVNWDKMYNSNQNIETFNGVTGKRSAYILGNDVEAVKRWNTAVNYQKVLSDHTTIYGGANYQNQSIHSFKEVADLLGGDYYVNLNQFGGRNFPDNPDASQFNLLNKDQVIKEGDIYSYDYTTKYTKSNIWAQSVHTFNKVDFFFNAGITNNTFYRIGNMKSGIYQNNSFGESQKINQLNYATKGGVTYKLNGRNYFYANAARLTRAPYFDNVFVSARTRNEVATDIKNETINSFEAGYLLRNPKLRGRVGFYATDITGAMDIKRYFDDVNLSLVNLLMTNINKRYTGLEFGFEYKASTTLNLSFASSLGQAFFTNRPTTEIYVDNSLNADYSTGTGKKDIAYIQNYYLPSGPQTAATIGANYRSPKFWFANVNLNYMDNNYIDFAPNVRTAESLGLVKENFGVDMYNKIVGQKKLNRIATVDATFGKSWLARKIVKQAPYRSTLNLNLGVNNLLNNKNIQLTGFEQLRFDQKRPNLFAPRYIYAIGAQYFMNLAYTF
jgi:Carboxypeptidase regulatory-like domain